MTDQTSADETALVSPDRVRFLVQGLLRSAQHTGWTDESLGAATGLKARRIKAYRVEDKEPPLSAALSIAVVLGKPAINAVLSLIGYTAQTLDEADAVSPCAVVGSIAQGLAVIAAAAADNHFDHTEMPAVTDAADLIIQTVVPYSRAGRAA